MERYSGQAVKKKKIGRFIFLFIILGIIISSNPFKHKMVGFFDKGDKTFEVISEKDITYKQNESIFINRNRFIKYSDSKIISYTIEGIEEWNRSISYKEPIIYLGKQNTYIADSQSGQVVVFDKEGKELWAYNPKQSIDYIIERNDNLILFMKAGDSLEQINILDKQGQLLSNTVINDGKIINVTISDNEKHFILTVLATTNNSIKSKIMYYSINGELIWQEIFNNQIIGFVDFTDNNNLVVVSDKRVSFYNTDKKLLWSRDIEGSLIDVKVDKDSIFLLTNKVENMLEIIKLNGKTRDKFEFTEEIERIYMDRGRIYLVGDKDVIGIEGERTNLKYVNGEAIKGFSISNNYAFIFTQDKLKKAKVISINNN